MDLIIIIIELASWDRYFQNRMINKTQQVMEDLALTF